MSKGEIVSVGYMTHDDFVKSDYPALLTKPYDVRPPVVGEEGIALPGDIRADAVAEDAAPEAMWDPWFPQVDATPRNPWFLCWDDRHEEVSLLRDRPSATLKFPQATQLLAYLTRYDRLVTFLDNHLLDFHMGNFHRLRIICAVDIRVYIRHILALGDVRTMDLEKSPEVSHHI